MKIKSIILALLVHIYIYANNQFENYALAKITLTKEMSTSNFRNLLGKYNDAQIVPTGKDTYYCFAHINTINELRSNSPFISIDDADPYEKLQKDLLEKIQTDSSKKVVFRVLLFQSISTEEAKALFSSYAKIVNFQDGDKTIILETMQKDIEKLLSIALVQYAEIYSKKLEIKSRLLPTNAHAAKLDKADDIWNELTGKGVKVAVIDEGRIRNTHQEFLQMDGSSRIDIGNNTGPLSSHATHVAGTIGAMGINPYARGMANESEIYSYYFYDFAFDQAISHIYNEENITLSNHSYGYFYNVYTGVYNIDAMHIDAVIYNNPYLNIFMAAGNDRDRYGYNLYGITKGPVNAKNIISVGAIDDQGNLLTSFSSTGPVYDGRIKPDLVANGASLLSTGSRSDKDYFVLDGTSMATPVATGIAALLMQRYKELAGRDYIRHDLLKALLINTAIDKGRKGPDYEYGYGLIDAYAADKTLQTIDKKNSLIQIDSIDDKERKKYCIDNRTEGSLKATIAWIDPPGYPQNQSKTLVNDIDIFAVSKNCDVMYPYTLNKNYPEAIAQKNKPNNTDNIEQLEFSSQQNGVILNVYGKEILSDKQDFTIVSNKPFVQQPIRPNCLSAVAIDNNSVHLFWHDNSDNEAYFNIYRDDTLICTTVANKEDMIDIRLQANTLYHYRVASVDICGRESFSKELRLRTPNKVNAPSNLSVEVLGWDTILLEWCDNSNNEDGYYIYRDGKLIAKLSDNNTHFLDHINIDKFHEYTVVAFNSTNRSCPVKKKVTLPCGNLSSLTSNANKHLLNIKYKRKYKFIIIAEKSKSLKNDVYLVSSSNHDIFQFSCDTYIDQKNRVYNVYRLEKSLQKGEYTINIKKNDNIFYKLFTDAPIANLSFDNFVRVIYQNITNIN